MSLKKKRAIIGEILIGIAFLFTILVKVVDVKAIGPNESKVGFASINQFFRDLLGNNMFWYHVTEILGIVALLCAGIYAVIGLIECIQRKSVWKVDRAIFLLGIFFILVAFLYVFFEVCIVNYRPILEDGALEASYPSSHTMMTMCICGGLISVNRKWLHNEQMRKIIQIILAVILITMVVGRLLSGVHWFTDIVGGVLISSGLLMLFSSLLTSKKE